RWRPGIGATTGRRGWRSRRRCSSTARWATASPPQRGRQGRPQDALHGPSERPRGRDRLELEVARALPGGEALELAADRLCDRLALRGAVLAVDRGRDEALAAAVDAQVRAADQAVAVEDR